MGRKILTSVLAMAMFIGTLGTIPVSAAEDSTTLATGVTEGTYTDTTAEAGQAYEYTVTGSDGSETTIQVAAETGEEEEVINSVTGPHAAQVGGYVLVDADDLADGIENGTYVLVLNSTKKAIISSADDYYYGYLDVENVTITDNVISDGDSTMEWNVMGSNGTYQFQDNDGNYLYLGSYSSVLSSSAQNITVKVSDSIVELWADGYTLGDYSAEDDCVGGASITPASILLFRERTATSGEYYSVDTSALNALIEEYSTLISSNYTDASWKTYEDALTTAKALRNPNNKYATREEANEALEEINTAQTALVEAYNALVQLETITIRPKWQRTLETNTTDVNDVGALITGVEYITNADDEDSNYSIITWADSAADILSLTTDPTMTVWDYNTDNQYATNETKVAGVSAATWNEHEEETGDSWKYGSVRRFTGTFTWPEGYDVDDTVVYQSVNDTNYEAIYEYINNDATLKARYGESKVFPINDDMFVFIRKANETLTTEDSDYLNHMLFWSGTSGKGVWCSYPDGGSGDWDRTVPPTFNGVNALPAYWGIMPNNNDATGTQATVDGLNISTMEHSDNWYTLVNSNTVMSTVKSLYGVEDLSNQEMVIDIFCFDNSGSGGMDEIELIFQKTPETATTVQVNYYLDSVLAANLLGSTVMTGVEDDTQITLMAGTNVNELDYYRFAAATKAGTVVSNGVQQAPVPYVVDIDKENNIINVVYTSDGAADRVYYFYDFGVENTFVYTPKEDAVLNQDYTITDVSNTNSNIKPSISSDKKNVILSYTPNNASGEMAVGTLNITFDSSYGTEVRPIVIAPASNVLFEEEFMSQTTNTENVDWEKSGKVDAIDENDKVNVVSDNENTVFGYTSSYKNSVGESGVYTATVDADASFTDTLEFQFGGTGFDLIGTCGPDTGTIVVKVVNSAGASVKNYLIDTSFTDTTGVVTEGTTIYQVPLLQATDLPEDIYTVTIRGGYIDYSGTTAATYAMGETDNTSRTDVIADIYELMYGVGMTEDDIDSVEYINMGKLMGASTYSTEGETTETTITTPEEMVIGIDGFRSYRATDYDKYPTTELGVSYENILSCVDGQFAAYIEVAEDGTYTVNDYELRGGPQNEIYLTDKNGSLAIAGSTCVAKQISLRSVDGNTVKVLVNGGKDKGGQTITINHTTEMYYEVTENESGYVIIQVESGFLGIGNLKLVSGDANVQAVMTTSLTEDDYAMVATTMRMYAAAPEVPEEPEVFEPEQIDIKMKAITLFRTKIVTVNVTVSNDVSYVTINGEKADENIFSRFIKKNQNTKTYTYMETMSSREKGNYEIIAYNADGIASITYTATR